MELLFLLIIPVFIFIVWYNNKGSPERLTPSDLPSLVVPTGAPRLPTRGELLIKRIREHPKHFTIREGKCGDYQLIFVKDRHEGKSYCVSISKYLGSNYRTGLREFIFLRSYKGEHYDASPFGYTSYESYYELLWNCFFTSKARVKREKKILSKGKWKLLEKIRNNNAAPIASPTVPLQKETKDLIRYLKSNSKKYRVVIKKVSDREITDRMTLKKTDCCVYDTTNGGLVLSLQSNEARGNTIYDDYKVTSPVNKYTQWEAYRIAEAIKEMKYDD